MPTDNDQAPAPARNPDIIGAPVDRTDGRLKVTGGARYSAEVNMPGLTYGVILTSTISNGTVASMDTAAAERAPGVLAVFTPFNMPKLPKSPSMGVGATPAARKLALLQDADVHYFLQPIGVVVADTLERATHAANLVKVKYDEGQPVMELVAHLHESFSPGQIGGSEKKPADSSENAPSAALNAAPSRIEYVYQTPTENHNAMEPHATIASWDDDHLTLFDATQGIFSTRNRVAGMFGLHDDNVRVICHYVGGGFGSKGPVWSHTMLAAMCAKEVKRPVKIALERAQMFNNTGSRAHTYQSLAIGADKDGKLAGIKHDVTNDTSSFDTFTESATVATRMLYACDAIQTTQRLVKLNLGTPSYMRAPGEAPGTFALESGLDELARELKMDPIELRLKNYTEIDPETKTPFSSKSLRQCYEQGAARFGWDRYTASPAPRSVRDGKWLVGYGMASATYPTNRSASNASACINSDGTALVLAGSQDLGTGTYTIMTQISSGTLGVPMDRVRFELGDSLLPKTPVSGGSQTAASTGSAVQAACVAVIGKLTEMALADAGSPLHNANAQDVVAADGKLSLKSDPSKSDTFTALLARAKLPRIEAKADSAPDKEEKKKFAMHAFGAQFAEVRVNEDTGEVRVSRWVGAFGIGKRLNEKTATSQIKGGVVFGIGMGLTEATIADERDARLVNPNLAEYHVPVNADIPEIDVIFVDEEDHHINPLGVKGVGEIGIVGVPAAIANAVYHATGVRVRELPITPDKVLGIEAA